MLDAAEHLAAIGSHDRRRIALQRVAERVVGGQKEPAVAAGFGQCLAGAVGKHVGVVGDRHRIRRAGLAGEIGGGGAGIHQHNVLLTHEGADGQRHAGVRRIGDCIDLVDIDPLPRHVGTDIRLVLVVAAEHLDLPTLVEQSGILHRHLGGDH